MGLFTFGKNKAAKEAVFNTPEAGAATTLELARMSSLVRSIMQGGGVNWGMHQYFIDFLEVPELNAIINIKAKAWANMRLTVESKATGKEMPNYEDLIRVFKTPNYFQSQKEFLTATKLNQEIFGNEILYFLTPVGMPNTVKGIFTISPQNIEIEIPAKSTAPWLSETLPADIKYWSNWNGKREILPQESMLHINNTPTRQTTDKWLWGISSLESLAPNIQNIRAAYEARNVLIKNRGALGILSNGSTDATGVALPLDKKEVEKVQEAAKQYGVTKDQYQYIITNLNLKWQQMSVDVEKLKLFEECREDYARICDVYGVPYDLIAKEQGTTYENQKQAEKRFYQNTIIPEAQEWVDGLNRRFETMNKSWHIVAKYDHLPIFQDDKKERGSALVLVTNALSKALADGAITIEQYKKELQNYGI